MTSYQATDFRVKVEPVVASTNTYDFGPGSALEHNSITLTNDYLRTLGYHAPRASDAWECYLWFYQTISGVQTAIDLSEFTEGAKYWDPVTHTGGDLIFALDADQVLNAGKSKLSIATVPSGVVSAGLYQFEITLTQNSLLRFRAGGWLEVLPARPSV